MYHSLHVGLKACLGVSRSVSSGGVASQGGVLWNYAIGVIPWLTAVIVKSSTFCCTGADPH